MCFAWHIMHNNRHKVEITKFNNSAFFIRCVYSIKKEYIEKLKHISGGLRPIIQDVYRSSPPGINFYKLLALYVEFHFLCVRICNALMPLWQRRCDPERIKLLYFYIQLFHFNFNTANGLSLTARDIRDNCGQPSLSMEIQCRLHSTYLVAWFNRMGAYMFKLATFLPICVGRNFFSA